MESKKQIKVGIFGGSFNPPHLGHVAICEWLLSKDLVDEVWIVPCYVHPFGKELVSFDDRYNMCFFAFGHLRGGVFVSRVEKYLGGTSHTVKTIKHLMELYPDYSFSLVTGGDVSKQTDDWKEFKKIKSLVKIITVPRGAKSPIPDISATEVRERIRQGKGIEGYVSHEVALYIKAHGLYK